MAELYDPLTYDNLMAGLALHFQRRPQRPLAAIEEDKIEGTGVDVSNPALRRRLREHARSVEAAENLNVADFTYKHMAVVPVWITLAERFLIEHYKPVWNLCLDGFGDHDPGSGRRDSQRSWWDTLHPGRSWAAALTGGKDIAEATAKVMAFLNKNKG